MRSVLCVPDRKRREPRPRASKSIEWALIDCTVTPQAGQVHPDGRARTGDHGRDRGRGRPLRLPPRRRHVVQLQHHGGHAALRRAQQVARLPEGLLGLVSRVRKVQNGHEDLGTETSRKFRPTFFLPSPTTLIPQILWFKVSQIEFPSISLDPRCMRRSF